MAKKEMNTEAKKDDLVVIDRTPKGEPFTLSKPIYDGATPINELYFDFDSLTVDHLLSVDTQLIDIIGHEQAAFTIIKATSLPYQLVIASLAAKVPYSVLKGVSAKDALAIGMRVQRFLTT